jgi:uncharacterized protein (TIGR03437 family)
MVGDQIAEVVFAGAAPTLVGVTQINLRIPGITLDSSPQRVLVGLVAGGHVAATTITLWLR